VPVRVANEARSKTKVMVIHRTAMTAVQAVEIKILCAVNHSTNPTMEDAVEAHISDEVLEKYSLETLATPHLSAEIHLMACASCRSRLETIEPVNLVHFTEDGPVYSRATPLRACIYALRYLP